MLESFAGRAVSDYDVHDYLDERRNALELWAAKLVTLEANKVPEPS